MSNKREHFRLEFPPSERPRVRVDGTWYEVLDASESGLKWACGTRYRPVGLSFNGRVEFKDGSAVEVAGAILRHDHAQGVCVVQLTQGIPLAKMLEEHRRIIRKMGGRK